MTSLRSFQDEIQKIHQREVVKQRAQAFSESIKAKEKSDANLKKAVLAKDAAEKPAAEPAPTITDTWDDDLSDSIDKLQVCASCRLYANTNAQQ